MSLILQSRAIRANQRALFHRSLARPSRLESSSLLVTLKSRHGVTQRRSFHVSELVQVSQDLIVSIHTTTGLSWAVAIPLIAFGVNILFRVPFTIYTQSLLRRRSTVVPLLQALHLRSARGVKGDVPQGEVAAQAKKSYQRESKRVYAALGLQQWKFWSPLLGVPFWFLSILGLRRLCSGSSAVEKVQGTIGGDPTSAQAVTPTDKLPFSESPVTTTPAAVSAPIDGGVTAVESPVLNGDPSTVSDLMNITSTGTDPSLTTEGMLWFANLAAADPYWVLPWAVAVVMLTNMIPEHEATRRAMLGRLATYLDRLKPGKAIESRNKPASSTDTGNLEGSTRLRLLRIGAMLCVAIPFLTAHFPAAVHLYWFTSASTTLLVKRLMSSRYPIISASVKLCTGREFPFIRPPMKQIGMKKGGEKSKI